MSEKIIIPEGTKELNIHDDKLSIDVEKQVIVVPNSVNSILCFEPFFRIECEKAFLLKCCNGDVEYNGFSASSCSFCLINILDENQKLLLPVSSSVKFEFQSSLPTNGEKLDFKAYDIHLAENKSGHKYKQKERLWAMMLRLLYPVELEEDNKNIFVLHLTKNIKKVFSELAEEVDEKVITFLIDLGIINKKNRKSVIEIAEELGNEKWIEIFSNSEFGESTCKTNVQKKQETIKKVTSKEKLGTLIKLYENIEKVKAKAAEISYTDEEMKKMWMVKENGTGAGWITRYKGKETEVVFPEEVAGIKILGIANRTGTMPANYPKLTSVVIPEGYEMIGSMAFEGCTSLKNISIPKSVTRIRDKAFMNCSSLETVVLPPTLKEGQSWIQNSGKWMFRDCSKLKDVYVLNSNVEIGTQAAFRGCDKIIVHMEDESKLKITDMAKHFAKMTEEEKAFFAQKEMDTPFIETVFMILNSKKDAPSVGSKVLLNNSEIGDDKYTEVIDFDGTVYGTISGVGVMIDYLDAKVVTEAYTVNGEYPCKAFDIEISYKK